MLSKPNVMNIQPCKTSTDPSQNQFQPMQTNHNQWNPRTIQKLWTPLQIQCGKKQEVKANANLCDTHAETVKSKWEPMHHRDAEATATPTEPNNCNPEVLNVYFRTPWLSKIWPAINHIYRLVPVWCSKIVNMNPRQVKLQPKLS